MTTDRNIIGIVVLLSFSFVFTDKSKPTKNFVRTDNSSSSQELEDTIYKGLVQYEEQHTVSPDFESALEQLNLPPGFLSGNPVSTTDSPGVCTGCAALVKYVITRNSLGISRDKLVDTLMFICTLFQVSTERVCMGLINLNIDIFLYIFNEKKNLVEYSVCAIIFQDYSCFKEYRTNWTVAIPNRDSHYTVKKSKKGQSFRILQITDLHVDPLYKSGGNADCGEPLCCQNDQGPPPSNSTPAGKWGDYRNCDMPYDSLRNFLQQITKQINQPGQQIDFVYFTGDIISHRVWNTSKISNTETIRKVYRILKDVFGAIPVYSIVGNHEPHPLNVFSPTSVTNELSTRWIYDVLADEWSKWLPSNTGGTTRLGGYYTVVVRPGFRIIGLNSNVCYTYNWWLILDSVDPFDQLKWLALTLKDAEANNEVVHILSHIPPGDSTCIQEWTRQFRRIVTRFSHVIKGQFNGHTHFDELRVFYNKSNPTQVVNVAYNGGSFTTFSNLNPNYRYYTIDRNTYAVLDYEQWIYDLDVANSKPDGIPTWFKQYSFKDAYNLTRITNKSIGNLINRMAHSTALQNQYQTFKVRGATPSLQQGCTTACYNQNLCDIVTTEVDDDTQCKALT